MGPMFTHQQIGNSRYFVATGWPGVMAAMPTELFRLAHVGNVFICSTTSYRIPYRLWARSR